jgi:hypothetical protein
LELEPDDGVVEEFELGGTASTKAEGGKPSMVSASAAFSA